MGVSMAKELIKISDHYDQIDVIVGMYGGVLDAQRFNVLLIQQYPNIKFHVTKNKFIQSFIFGIIMKMLKAI